ncbi:MAG: nitronate monooxygenase family protein [Desulfocurvibacter africanus]
MAMPPLTIGDLSVPVPIIQGGMGVGISLSGLAAAVANAGGIGIIATADIGWDEPDFKKNFREANKRALRRHIRKARSLTKGVLGVNIMVALTNYDDMVEVSVEEGVDLIISGAGLPLGLPKLMEGKVAPKLLPIVSSGRATQIICKKWKQRGRLPDAIVVEGPLAGGHLGFKPEQVDEPGHTLEQLIPEVIAAVQPFADAAGAPIPVIAAGGIYTGSDICRFLRMGAAGVQMGTRFVATHECDAAPEFKQAYLDAKECDMALIKSPVGLPGRAIRNPFLDEVDQGGRKPKACLYRCVHGCDFRNAPFCISEALISATQGKVANGLVFAGHNAYRVDKILSVQELMQELVREYDEVCGQ